MMDDLAFYERLDWIHWTHKSDTFFERHINISQCFTFKAPASLVLKLMESNFHCDDEQRREIDEGAEGAERNGLLSILINLL